MKSYFIIQKKSIVVITIWFFLNLIFLLFSDFTEDSKKYFFPFELYEKDFSLTYDFTEFFVYGFTPIILFFIINFLNNGKEVN
jgi:hypothetical protein